MTNLRDFFACSSMNFLGNRIDKMGIRSSINHVDKIVNYPRPSTRAELKRWLGICAYTSRMVENASVILAPLHKTCSPKSEFKWNNDDQAAFDLFKTKLAESSGLHHRDETLPLVLCTDASLNKFGAILYQGQLGSLQPLAYHSGLFTAAERRISSRHRELLAITFSIRRFEYDLIGQTFVVITDHRSLVNLLTAKSRNELNLKLVNCLYYLFQFDFSVSYAAGESNIMKASDALSRTPISKADILELAERNEIPEKVFFLNTLPSTLENETQKTRYYLRSVSKIIQEENNELHGPAQPHKLDELTAHVIRIADKTFSKDEIVRLQRQCRHCANIRTKIEQKSKSTIKRFSLIDGLLFATTSSKANKRLVIPASLSDDFIGYVHVAYGHCGTRKLLELSRRNFYVFNVVNRTKTILNSCFPCVTSKPRPPMKPNLQKPKSYSNKPWEVTHVDLWDAGKADRRSKRYLVAITDALTGYTDGIALSRKTENAVCDAMITLILRHGIFDARIVSDNGREFSNIWDTMLSKLANKGIHCSPYNSRGNSSIERRFKDFNTMLRANNVNNTVWSEHLHYCLFYLNNLPRDVLGGLTPTEALWGRAIQLPILAVEDCTEKPDFLKNLNRFIKSTHTDLAHLHNQRFGKIVSTSSNSNKLQIGDSVVAYQPDIKATKFCVKYDGPYTIIKQLNPSAYIVRCPNSHKELRRHVRHLRPLYKDAKLN